MPALINNIISPQNFELIRDQIGAILLVEFTNQAANYGLPVNCTPKLVKIEGFLQIDDDTLPAITIRFARATEQQKDGSGNAIYDCCYYIDVYTGDASTPEENADQRASLALQRMFGICRAVLEDPRYDLLAFDSGQINIWNTHIEDYYIDLPKNNDDLSDAVCGRIEFHVTAAEIPSSYIGTNPVEWVDTTVRLVNTDRGYHWIMKQQQINVITTGNELTNSFFSNPIAQIIIGDITYSTGSDFTQRGTTITAITFSFTANTTIIASTL